jgi:hypothetical protein
LSPLLKQFSTPLSPNVVVECLTFLLCILEVPNSNLDPETRYPDWGVSWFPLVPPGKCRESTIKLGQDRFLQNRLQFIIHLSSYVVRRYFEKASLNKLQINKIKHPYIYHNSGKPLFTRLYKPRVQTVVACFLYFFEVTGINHNLTLTHFNLRSGYNLVFKSYQVRYRPIQLNLQIWKERHTSV